MGVSLGTHFTRNTPKKFKIALGASNKQDAAVTVNGRRLSREWFMAPGPGGARAAGHFVTGLRPKYYTVPYWPM